MTSSLQVLIDNPGRCFESAQIFAGAFGQEPDDQDIKNMSYSLGILDGMDSIDFERIGSAGRHNIKFRWGRARRTGHSHLSVYT